MLCGWSVGVGVGVDVGVERWWEVWLLVARDEQARRLSEEHPLRPDPMLQRLHGTCLGSRH